jgi:hypothetical protein
MKYPIINDNRFKLYKYIFDGIDKPVIIQARNRNQAREAIRRYVANLATQYQSFKIVGESVSVPAKGVSKKSENNKNYIWVGESKSKDGWMEEKLYLEKIKKHDKIPEN